MSIKCTMPLQHQVHNAITAANSIAIINPSFNGYTRYVATDDILNKDNPASLYSGNHKYHEIKLYVFIHRLALCF